MKTMRLYLVLAALAAGTLLARADDIGGTITTDTVLDIAGSPWHVTAHVTVNAGITLTIDPDVELIFDGNFYVYVYGGLQSNGTAGQPVDINGGGGGAGSWQSFIFYNADLAGSFSYTTLSESGSNGTYGTVYAYNSTVTLTNCSIHDALYDGLVLTTDAIVNVDGLSIYNTRYPVYLYSAEIVFNLAGINDFSTNTYPQIRCTFTSITQDLDLDGCETAYYFHGNVTVNNGFKLTLNEGVKLKFNSNRYIYVHGAFASLGTVADPNYITHIYDDNIAGDSNGDGSATSPVAGGWNSIYFYDDANDLECDIEYSTVRFGNSSVYTENASPTLSYCDMTNSHYPLHLTGTSAPTISNCTFGTSTYTPIYMSLSANPTMVNNDFSTSNNGYDAIGIIPETLSASGYLPVRDFTSAPNVTYVFMGSVTVPAGLTLTIDQDVVIKWTQYSHGLTVEGDLIAQGTVSEPIVFTSVKDDTYGNPADTNNDGSITSPADGDWRGIELDGGGGDLEYLVVRYSGGYRHNSHGGFYRYAALGLFNSTPTTLSNCTFFNNRHHGLVLYGNSDPAVVNCDFQNHTYTPIAMTIEALPTFTGNTFTNNSYTALGILGSSVGANCTLPQRTVAGYANITYLLEETLTINSGTHVVFDPGVVMKFFASTQIMVEGSLEIVGTSGNEIYLTSRLDDNYGNPGDTNNDGNGTIPDDRDWYYVNFLPTADDPNCHVSYAWLGYGGTTSDGVIRCEASGPTIDNSTITTSYYGISMRGNSTPTVEDCVIQNCIKTPIYMSVTSNPTISFNNLFTNNGYFALGIINEALSTAANLPQRDVAGVNNFTYLFLNDFWINPGGHLTLEEGVTAKFLGNCSMLVDGAFSTLGTAMNRVHLTSYRDDSIGGDTNEDGSGTSPATGNWGIVSYRVGSDGVSSLMEHTVVRFGSNDSYWYGQIRINTSAPTIRDCEITNAYWGVEIFGNASPTFTDNTMVNITRAPVYLSLYATPTFSGNQFFNAGYYAIDLRGETISVNDIIPVMNFGGYTNITWNLYGNLTVNSTTDLEVAPDVVLKSYGYHIYVNGSFDADQATFTSLYDDSVGNPADTEDNGSATTPGYTNWPGIDFNDISEDANCELTNCMVRYATYGVECTNAAPTLTNTDFESCRYGLYLNGNSPAVLNNVSFNYSQYTPVLQSLVTDADYTTTTFGTLNTYNGIGIKGETLAQDITLHREASAGISNLVYVLQSNLTVGSSATLTIDPGVVIKATSGRSIGVHKGISAIGGPDADDQIVFTYIEDDFYGGDTNIDGDLTEPTTGESSFTLYFYDDSWDALCNLDYCVFAWGGYSSTRGMADIQSASPLITNCVFRDGRNGVSASGSSNPVINNCDIIDNQYYGIRNSNPAITINAENNWWGDPTGPYDGSDDTGSGGLYNPGGLGDEVTDYVDYDPWATSLQHPLLGDVSLNGEIHAFDASLILSHVAGSIVLTPEQLAVADVTGMGGVNSTDAYYILQYVVGNITTFPGETTLYEGEPWDPESQLITSIAPLEDEWQATFELTGDNLLRGFEIDCRYDPAEVAVTAVEMGDDLNFSVQWHAEEGVLKIAMAAFAVPEEIPITVNVTLTAATTVDEENFAATRFVVNDQEFILELEDVVESTVPEVFALHQNYPNPFNPSTTIRFDLPQPQLAQIAIYNLRGQLVRELLTQSLPAGSHEVVWDGRSDYGNCVASGLYFYRFESELYHAVSKMTVIK